VSIIVRSLQDLSILWSASLLAFLAVAGAFVAPAGTVVACENTPQHFSFDDRTGASYLVILKLDASQCLLDTCDEIGVFDGELCVGAAIVTADSTLGIVAWQDDPQTSSVDGYRCGESMTFRLWRAGAATEEMWAAAFEPGQSGLFCEGLYTSATSDCTPTGVEELDTPRPDRVYLLQNYPNPFNSTTTIRFTLPVGDHMRLRILNSLGQEVTLLADEWHPAGEAAYEWSGRNSSGHPVASGVYFYQLQTSNASITKRMLLLK